MKKLITVLAGLSFALGTAAPGAGAPKKNDYNYDYGKNIKKNKGKKRKAKKVRKNRVRAARRNQ